MLVRTNGVRRNKFNARKTVVDGITFDSAKEARRYNDLAFLFRAGFITGLELQPEFKFNLEGKKIFTYRADFAYFENQKRVIEDVKGFKTPLYRLKKKIIEAAYHVQIIEV